MFQEVEQELDTTESAQSQNSDTPNKRRKIVDEREEHEDELPEIPAPDFVQSHSAGFLTGKGKAVPPPSKAAMEKAMKIIAAVEEEKEEVVVPEATPPARTGMSSFTTGNGNAVAGPSKSASAAVRDLFSNNEATSGAHTAADEDGTHFATPSKLPTSGFTTGSGAPAGGINDDARRRAMAIFGDEPTSTPSRRSTSMLPPTSTTPFRPLTSTTATPVRLSQTPMLPVTTDSGSSFRTPLRTTTNTAPLRQVANVGSQAKVLTPIAIKTPAPPRRVGLGRTPTSRGKVKNTFASPFKNPSQSNSPLKTATLRTSSMAPSALSRAAPPAAAPIIVRPVFDLASKPTRPDIGTS
jgi:hypothetical protein